MRRAAVGGRHARLAAGSRRGWYRIRNWECANSSNSYPGEDGNTQRYLPDHSEYRGPRRFTDFPELPGQSLDPIFDPSGQAQ